MGSIGIHKVDDAGAAGEGEKPRGFALLGSHGVYGLFQALVNGVEIGMVTTLSSGWLDLTI